MKELTVRQSYCAMYIFIKNFHELIDSDDLGGFLKDMSFLEDGSTADPASWQDWLEAVEKAVQDDAESKCMLRLTKKEG